jgi:hypothetical protein
MNMQPFEHAILTLNLLENQIKHMNAKWQLYTSIGYLPKTEVFKILLDKIKISIDTTKRIKSFTQLCVEIPDKSSTNKINYRFQNFLKLKYKIDCVNNTEIKKFDDGKTIQLGGEENSLFLVLNDDKTEATLIIDDRTVDKLKVVEENGKLIIHQHVNKYTEISNLATLRNTLFYNIERISDIINALNYGFLNRLIGIVASDPVLGMEVACRQYGGVQLIHNGAESLMKDYVESYGDNEYNGIVVFGFKNRASTLDELIVHFPSYAEHDLEYLVVLAHESFHITTYKSMDVESANGFKDILKEIQKFIKDSGLALLYLPETFHDINTPEDVITEVLADDIMADIYATIVAGAAYPKILSKYYLPIILDTDNKIKPAYCSFVIGSLKLRVAALALEILDLEYLFSWDDLSANAEARFKDFLIKKFDIDWVNNAKLEKVDYGKVIQVADGENSLFLVLNDTKENATLIICDGRIDKLKIEMENDKLNIYGLENELIIRILEDIEQQIENWEKFSKELALDVLKSLPKELSDINAKVILLCRSIGDNDLPKRMLGFIKHPFYPKQKEERNQLKKDLGNISELFKGEPEPTEILGIWGNKSITPRHLISLLALDSKEINRNALLIAIGYHEYILKRFEPRNG